MRTTVGIIGGGPAGLLLARLLHRAGVDFPVLTGGRTVTIYARTEIVRDLVALQLADGPPLLFEAEALAVEHPQSGTPVVRFRHEGRERSLGCDWGVGWELRRGPITAKSVTPMRSCVHEPMRHGRLLLARAFVELHTEGSTRLLDGYAELSLQRVWQATRFSYDMTRMLHAQPDGDAFDHRMQHARLRRITASRHAAAEPAANYTGLPLPL
ncbi:FAD-dependent monooxygenase [Streptomyces sp. NPDC002143]